MCSSQLYVMSTVNTATEYLQSSVSLWNTDSTPFSANDCILGKKWEEKEAYGSVQKTQLICAANQLRA